MSVVSEASPLHGKILSIDRQCVQGHKSTSLWICLKKESLSVGLEVLYGGGGDHSEKIL